MLSHLEFKVVQPAQDSLERATHEWLREVLFFIGASWYANRKDFKTVYEVSSKLKLRWLFSHNRVSAAIEQTERHNNWMGSYSIGNGDPFVFDGCGHDDTELVEGIVTTYLPKIEIVQCGICGARFGNTLQEEGWRCDDCVSDFPHSTHSRAGFVYIFGCTETGYYKIGCGNTPNSRMKDYERAKLPFPVEMLHTIPADDKERAEAELHRLYREQRTNGEWFKLTADDLARIIGLKKYVGGHWFESRPTYAGVGL